MPTPDEPDRVMDEIANLRAQAEVLWTHTDEILGAMSAEELRALYDLIRPIYLRKMRGQSGDQSSLN